MMSLSVWLPGPMFLPAGGISVGGGWSLSKGGGCPGGSLSGRPP